MKTTFTLILIIYFFSANSQTFVKQWDKRFGGNGPDFFFAICSTNDDGVLLGGRSVSNTSGDKTEMCRGINDFWIVKVDANGVKQWDKTFGGVNQEELYAVEQTNDNGYILGGYSESDSGFDKSENSRGSADFWIVKTDSSGNKLWDKTYGGSFTDQIFSIQQTSDLGFICGGISYSDSSGDKTEYSHGSMDYWIIKLDAQGNKQWDKTFGGAGMDQLNTVKQTPDGGYILGGRSDSEIGGDKTQSSRDSSMDYWIIKTDNQGNKEWDKTIGGEGYEWFTSLLIADNGFVLFGSSNSNISYDKTQNSNGSSDYWLVKIDASGNIIWDKDYGSLETEETDFGLLAETLQGQYLLSGTSYAVYAGGDKSEANYGIEQTWLICTDTSGNKIWDKTIFTGGHDECGQALQTTRDCYLIASASQAGIGGYKSQPAAGNNSIDYWIVNLCEVPNTSVSPFADHIQCSLFPNPSTSVFSVLINNRKTYSCTVLSTSGQILLSTTVNDKENKIDAKNLADGVYLVQLKSDDSIYTFKLIKN
jgi:hypothetical protein